MGFWVSSINFKQFFSNFVFRSLALLIGYWTGSIILISALIYLAPEGFFYDSAALFGLRGVEGLGFAFIIGLLSSVLASIKIGKKKPAPLTIHDGFFYFIAALLISIVSGLLGFALLILLWLGFRQYTKTFKKEEISSNLVIALFGAVIITIVIAIGVAGIVASFT